MNNYLHNEPVSTRSLFVTDTRRPASSRPVRAGVESVHDVPTWNPVERVWVSHFHQVGQERSRFVCQIRVRDLQDPRLQLRDDLLVVIELAEGIYTAYCHDLDEFGSGSSEAEALQDFRAAVADLYFLLRGEREARLGPMPLAHWRYLSRIIREA